jgi:hypothetical protein
VRRYEEDPAFSLSNAKKGPVHLKIMLHYWGKQRAYWGKCPSSYIVKNALPTWLTVSPPHNT